MYFFLLTVVTAVSNHASSFLTIHRLLSETPTNSHRVRQPPSNPH